MSPSAAYEAGIAAGRWQADPAQQAILPELDRLHAAVTGGSTGWLARMLRRRSSPADVDGLYLWGGVGRGKTFLVDLLAASLPASRVLRRHFHRFMAEVHAALVPLRAQGRSDPLEAVAADIAGRCRLLCLDEFIVQDIGDAMILSGLLQALFARGVVLATTSNTPPAQLYRDGLQRARFLPAIALLEQHCRVVELVSPTDYRLRNLVREPVYLVPSGPTADARLRERFDSLTAHGADFEIALAIEGRDVAARAAAEGVAWFDFAVLCEGPRATADYIVLARRFNTVLISGVPVFTARGQDDAAQRFIHLVDEFYDRRVKLVLSADAEPTALYRSGRLRAAFERTESRLIEMQSANYLAQAHQP